MMLDVECVVDSGVGRVKSLRFKDWPAGSPQAPVLYQEGFSAFCLLH